MVMPNDVINGQSIPTPRVDSYDTLTDLVSQIKSYAKEVGFSVVVTGATDGDGK